VRRAAWCAAVFVALAVSGCDDPEADVEIRIDPADLPCAGPDGNGGWESVPWSEPGCDWLPYPGRTALQVPHDLGRRPSVVLPYLSFYEDGDEPALSFGDTARISEVTETTVTVANTTNAHFFLRLALQ
jgi:hypothetical protein